LNANPENANPQQPPPVETVTPKDQFTKQATQKNANQVESEPEQTLWEGGYSPKAMFGTWLIVAIISVALLVVAFLYQMPTIPIALGIIVSLWVLVACVYAYRRLGYHYELTSQRFIHQVGVLSRKTDRIEVIDIDDVSFFQGPIQRMLGIGTIDITGSDRSHPHLLMRGIADVKTVAGLIDDIRRKERKKRSLHIQSI
jgi:membrane protein YdbS with pleckstrin-like domain